MSFVRAVFAFALLMLVVGIVGSRFLAEKLFGPAPGPTVRIVANAADATATATPTSIATPTSHPAQRIAATVTVQPTPSLTATHTATPRPRRTPRPTPTPTTRVVTLARYWVGTLQARRGRVVSIGYVIDNETGQPAHVLLGASLKPSGYAGWGAGSLSDPGHDVVAIVPPGVSTHVRYFALPPRLHPGAYDVAWGLRNAVTGMRNALVTAPDVIRVTR